MTCSSETLFGQSGRVAPTTTWHVRNSVGEWITGIRRDLKQGSAVQWGTDAPYSFASFGRAQMFATHCGAVVVTVEQLSLFGAAS